MKNEKLKYQLALTMIPKIGSITAKKLIAYLGSPEEVFRERPENLRKIPGIGNYLANQVNSGNYLLEAEREIFEMKKRNISCVYFQDALYPWRLKNCEDGPLLLYFLGNPDFQRAKVLSIVGTRSATSYGRDITRRIISELSEKYPELIIVSGLAYGIDIIAHRSALENKLDTFAVLAHGLKTIYPSMHAETALRITKQGGLLTDFHSNIKAERNNFLRRNRIIAGISEATLVVESGQKGGALITADIASSYSREVLAIPGRITDTYSKGCNNLIKNNIAALVNSASDIEEILGWEASSKKRDSKSNNQTSLSSIIQTALSVEEEKILKAISDEPGIGQEILSIRTNIPLSKLMAILLQMEFKNWVTVMPGNSYSVCP